MSELTDGQKAELRHKWETASNGDVLRLTDEEVEYLNSLAASDENNDVTFSGPHQVNAKTGLDDPSILEYTVVDSGNYHKETIVRWPRPIPVSERLPEDGQRCQWFNSAATEEHYQRWCYGVYHKGHDVIPCDPLGTIVHPHIAVDYEYIGQNIPIISSLDAFSHWLPEPPSPE